MTQQVDSRRLLAALSMAALFAALLGAPALGQASDDPSSGSAQEAQVGSQRDSSDRTQAIVHIEHADPESVANVVRVFGVHALAHPEVGVITIEGPRKRVEAARAAAVELDRPPAPTKSIQVVAYVLDASKTAELAGGVPEDLGAVAGQLRQIFGYRGVELIDTLAIRVLDGGAGQVTGTLPASAGRPAMPYTLGFNGAKVIQGETAGSSSVRLTGFAFNARTSGLPSESGESPQGLESVSRLVTDLEVRAGQKAVVGKAATAGEREGLIVVVVATVLE